MSGHAALAQSRKTTLTDPTAMTQTHRNSNLSFENAVSLTIGDETVVVDSVVDALACLLERFPDQDAPSCRRAITACQTSLSATGSIMGAQSTFIVAAMEAGIRFELFDKSAFDLERQIAIAAEES